MKIVISILGTTLDQHGRHKGRWNVWRPSVALCMQADLSFDRYYLLASSPFAALRDEVMGDIRQIAPETEVIPVPFDCADPWDFETVYAALYDFSKQLNPRPEKDDYYIHITTGTHVAQICLFLLNESRHLPGRLIQTQPSRNAPEGKYMLIDLDLSRYDQLSKRFETERCNDVAFLKSGIATRNPSFNTLIEKIERVAIRSKHPILLTGPTGAGKSQLARRIYELKKANRQVSGAFVDVNCATLRGDGAMSALFGHEKGAFTGAARNRPGLLKSADNGVLFLDEIGELGPDEQAMLLRAIEEKTFLPLGSDEPVASQFQLICGTNRDLSKAVREGRFRDDLLARVNLWRFTLPGLADRREDIEPNLNYELEQFSRKNGTRVTFNKEARKRFLAFACSPATPWHGNFRELNAMMTRMATLATGGRIDTATVENEIRDHASGDTPQISDDALLAHALGAGYEARYDRFDLVQLKDVLRVYANAPSIAHAGKQLFAVSRDQKRTSNDTDRLSKYLRRFGITAQTLFDFPPTRIE